MYKYNFLNVGSTKYNDLSNFYIDWIINNQLKDANNWKHFTDIYELREDGEDLGWRGEYFGKMMRGACLVYRYKKDESLYKVLEKAVKDLLTKQDDLGRFSTYTVETEFQGWDIWSRKYVMTGMLHFYDICHDEDLKNQIVEALKKHADYMISKLGNKEGQIDITTTSNFWGGVNSCSVLEPFINLYKVSKEERFLEFARYIISTGGCHDGNLIEIADKDELYPYQYPEVKAYETMSFFEGLMAYSEVTGETKYFDIVEKFIHKVIESDITIIGSAGCTHELFDHSIEKQTEYSDIIMQETCVTVTWIRLMTRYILNTGNLEYAKYLEQSIFNGLYGAVNIHHLKNHTFDGKGWIEDLPFDSYSPLFNNHRGKGTGGYKAYKDGFGYGCCACIGAAGIGLGTLDSVFKSSDGLAFLYYLNGHIEETLDNNEVVDLSINSSYLQNGNVVIKFNKECTLKLTFRIPDWANEPTVSVKGSNINVNGLSTFGVNDHFDKDEEIVLNFHAGLQKEERNGKVAYTYGANVLAIDSKKNPDINDLGVALEFDDTTYEIEEPVEDEVIRLSMKDKKGNKIFFTDYSSSGKNWLDERNIITVWIIKK